MGSESERPLRIIVCGGRDYADAACIRATLDELHASRGVDHLFHGNASGADRLAGEWGASTPGVRVHPVPAQWSKFGKRAGPIRNRQMLGQGIDVVVAFPGGRGTADMMKAAREAGVEVMEVANG